MLLKRIIKYTSNVFILLGVFLAIFCYSTFVIANAEINYYDTQSKEISNELSSTASMWANDEFEVTSSIDSYINPTSGDVNITDNITIKNLTSDSAININSVTAQLNSGFETAQIGDWTLKNNEKTLFNGTAGTIFSPELELNAEESKTFSVSTTFTGAEAGKLANTNPFKFDYNYEVEKPEAYAVVRDSGETNATNDLLEFRYDKNRADYALTFDVLNTENKAPGWAEYIGGTASGSNNTVTTVNFDSSFSEVKPESCYLWFAGYSTSRSSITSINNLQYLNTENVKNMQQMFSNSITSTPPDTGNWDTSSVTNMTSMFSYCNNWTSPPDTENWNTEKVTNMGRMFWRCSKLETPPDTGNWDTSKVTDFNYMFNSCSKMTTPPNTSNWNTSLVTNFSSMFEDCYVLSTPPNTSSWSTSSATTFSYMFDECYKLATPPDTSNWNTNKTTSMSNMFCACIFTDPPDTSKWDVSKVTSMTNMFSSCSKLATPPDTSNWNTSAVQNFGGIFEGCSALTASPDMSKWNTSQAISIYSMFLSCSKITNIDISSFNISNVTDTHAMFAGASALTTIYCNSDWSASTKITNSYNMFNNCPKLPHYDTSKVDKMYAYPDNGTTGYFTPKNPIMSLTTFTGGHYEDTIGTVITQVTGNYNDNVRVKIVITDDTKEINTIVDNTGNAYTVDENNFITIPLKFNGSITTTLKDKKIDPGPLAFTALGGTLTANVASNNGNSPDIKWSTDKINWQPLTSDVTVTGAGSKIYFKGDNPTGFSKATNTYTKFVITGDCNVSGCVMSLIDDGNSGTITSYPNYCFCRLFQGCGSIKSIQVGLIPEQDPGNYCFAYFFQNCTGLTTIPVGFLPAKSLFGTYCYAYMFQGCTALTSIPSNLLPATQLTAYCYYSMFRLCSSLTSIPEGLLPATELEGGCYYSMFRQCTSLTTIPNNFMQVNSFKTQSLCWMFYGCSSLKVSENGAGNKIFTCPDTSTTTNPASDMFAGTAGTFTGTPTTGNSYYCTSYTTIPNNSTASIEKQNQLLDDEEINNNVILNCRGSFPDFSALFIEGIKNMFKLD